MEYLYSKNKAFQIYGIQFNIKKIYTIYCSKQWVIIYNSNYY